MARTSYTKPRTCPACKGAGRYISYKDVRGVPKRETKACKRCKGTGKVS